MTPAASASVLVLLTGTQTPANIFSDDGFTPTANPVTTDSNGRFGFFVADGRYDLAVSGANFTTFTLSNIEIADVTEASSSDSNWITEQLNFVNQGADPSTPFPGNLAVYSKSSNRHLFIKDETGLVTDLTVTGGGGNVTTGGNNNFTGNNTFPNINNELWVDGTTYPISCAGLQSAISATATLNGGLSGGTIVHLPVQAITCSQQITFPSGRQIVIQGSGPGSQIVNNFGTDALFLAQGTLGVSSTTTAGYSPGTISVVVSNGSLFSANKWVEVASVVGDPNYNACVAAPSGGGGQCNSELILIDSVSGNTLNFQTSLSNTYATGATVTLVTPAVVRFKDLAIINSGQNFAAIKFLYCINCGVDNIQINGGLFTDALHPTIQVGFYHSTLGFIKGGLFGSMDGILAGGTQSAPLLIAGASSRISVDNAKVYKYVENAIVENAHDITINGGDYNGCVDDCWNTHGSGSYNITFNGGNYGGSSPNSNFNGYCIVISQGSATLPDHNIAINGINCRNYGAAGIAINGNSTPGAAVYNVTITGGTVKNGLKVGGAGVLVLGCKGCTVTGVNVTDVAANSNAFYSLQNDGVTFTGNHAIQNNGASGTIGMFVNLALHGNYVGNYGFGHTQGMVVTGSSTTANNFYANQFYTNAGVPNYTFDPSITSANYRWGNIGDTFSANITGDSPYHGTFHGLSPTANTSANTFSTNTFAKSIKILSISAIAVTAPTCTTYPTYVVTDGTTSTSALTVNAGYTTTAIFGTAFPANDAISIRQTNTPSCSVYPANINFSVEYAEVGN